VSGTNTRSVTRDLTNALVKTGRFEVMNDQRIRAALQEEKVANPDQFNDPTVLQALWKRLRVSAVLLSKLSLMEKAVNWDVQVISTVRGDSITLASSEVKGAAPRPASSSARGGAGNFAGREAPRIDQIALRSQEVPFKAQAMTAGELTGDGTIKLAITDGQGVYIYDLDKTGLKEIARYPGNATDNVIALDAADINGNGVAEIFVTKYSVNKITFGGEAAGQALLRSMVLEYQQGKLVKIMDEMPLNFRVLKGLDGSAQLYGQTNGMDIPFDGPVRQYTWRGNQYVPGPVVPLPKAYNTIYGFTLADLDGEGAPKVLVLDHLDHLRVFDRGGQEIYRSSDRYGGSELVLEFNPEHASANSRSGIMATTYLLQGRMYFEDILGDGKKQLIVPQNTPSTGYTFQTRLYDKGKIFGLNWDGVGMQAVWETRELPGYIADYALIDPDGDGNRKLVLLVVQTGLLGFAKSRSTVVVLDIRPPGN